MSKIDAMKLRIQELYRDIHELEKNGYTTENSVEITQIQKKIKDLQIAIAHRKAQIGIS